MRNLMKTTGVVMLLVGGLCVTHAATVDREVALNTFWSEVSRTVAEGDFAGYAATYHADAVLVSQSRGSSVPITKALERWHQGFLDTQAGKTTANVKFRFTHRLNDETTAHETGIFHYTSNPADGEAVQQYVHFEALLVRKNGWKMIMEYQKEPATEAEWNAAR